MERFLQNSKALATLFVVVSFFVCSSAFAYDVASVTVGTASGTATFGTGVSINYTLSFARGGAGNQPANVPVTISGLPAGVTSNLPQTTTGTNGAGGVFSNMTLTLTVSSTAAAGTYTFTVTANGKTATGSITINRAALSISANNGSKVYGTTQGATVSGSTAFSSTGLQNGNTIGTVTLTYGAGALAASAAVGSTSTITPSAATGGSFTATNYNITYVSNSGTLTVTPAPLSVTANNASKCFNTTYILGTSAFTTSGLQNSETITSVTLTSAGASIGAAAGSYPIIPSAATGSFSASNYSITYVNGSLTVITSPNAPTGLFGAVCSPGTVNISATPGVGETIDWYDAATGGTLLLSNSTTFTTPSISATTIYYASARNTTSGCVSTSRTAISAVVYATFTSGSINTTGEVICYNGNPSLIGNATFASGGDTSITYKWQANGNDIPGSNAATYDPPTGLTATTTYTRYAKDNTCNPTFTISTGSWVVTVSLNSTWTGTTSTAWATASNWSCGVVPASVSNVTISTATFYPEISSDVTINSLTLDSGTNLKVNAAYDLTVTDVINNNGTLTVESTANLLQVNNVANTGSGATVIKRNSSLIKRLDYTLWSSPVTGQGLYAFSPTTLPNRFYVYNTSNNTYSNSVGFNLTGLQYPSPLVAPNGINGTDANNVPFALGKSYLIRAPWDHPTAPAAFAGIFTGVANNGNLNYAMSTGYNAVGNVYPSRINVHDFIDGNPDISGPLYFWRKTNDASSPSYATLTKLAYTQNFAVGGDTGTGFFNVGDEANWVINVGQGFIVNATSNANLNFTNGMRRSLNSNQFFRAPQNTTTSINDGIFWLNLSNQTAPISQMAVGYISDATLGVDRGIDGKNINQEYFLTSLIDTDDYSIQGRPGFTATDVVPLSYKVIVAGNHSISIDHSSGIFATGQSIYLRDNLTATVHDLTTGAYNFTSDAGTFASRFDVIYQSQLGVGAPVFNANEVVVYQNDANDFVINTGDIVMSSVKVFDIRGRLLLTSKEINASQTTITAGQANQVLLVQITSQDGLVVTKKVIR